MAKNAIVPTASTIASSTLSELAIFVKMSAELLAADRGVKEQDLFEDDMLVFLSSYHLS